MSSSRPLSAPSPVHFLAFVVFATSIVLCPHWSPLEASSGQWSQLQTQIAPPERLNHLATFYDPIGDRMIVFGGNGAGAGFRNDVWVLSLGSNPTWTQLFPSGGPPEERQGCAAIYDAARHRLVIWGGQNSYEFLNDTWELSLAGNATWTRLFPSGGGPPACDESATVDDPAHDRMIVFGGRAYSGVHNQTWQLSFTDLTWTRLFPSGVAPAPRYAHSFTYDPVRNQMIVFGGYDGWTFFGDTRALSLSGAPQWSQMPGPGPNARYAMYGVYDSLRDRVVLFGGYNGGYFNDTWELTLNGTPAWSQMSITGSLPLARTSYSNIYDPVRDRLIMFAGFQNPMTLNDTWFLEFGPPVSEVCVDCPPQGHRAVSPGDSFSLSFPVCNCGNIAADYDWCLADEFGWRTQECGTLSLEPDECQTVTVNIQVPQNATPGNPNVFTFSVTPGGDPSTQVECTVEIPVRRRSLETDPVLNGVELYLSPSRPNPFVGSTEFTVSVGSPKVISVHVMDTGGRLVKRLADDVAMEEGTYSWYWNGLNDYGQSASPGLYYIVVRSESERRTVKVILTQ